MAERFKESNDLSADLRWTREASASIASGPVIRIAVAKRGASVGMMIRGAQDIVFRKMLVTAPE